MYSFVQNYGGDPCSTFPFSTHPDAETSSSLCCDRVVSTISGKEGGTSVFAKGFIVVRVPVHPPQQKATPQ